MPTKDAVMQGALRRCGIRMAMWRFCAVALSSACLFGCTATYNAGSTNSRDEKYRVSGHVRGAYGRAYTDCSQKRITVTIYAVPSDESRTREKRLLQRQYVVTGADVGWEATWNEDSELSFVVYDYGSGVDRWDARKNGISRRHLRTLIYRFNPTTGTFIEKTSKTQESETLSN